MIDLTCPAGWELSHYGYWKKWKENVFQIYPTTLPNTFEDKYYIVVVFRMAIHYNLLQNAIDACAEVTR